jgi:hypothetical protein
MNPFGSIEIGEKKRSAVGSIEIGEKKHSVKMDEFVLSKPQSVVFTSHAPKNHSSFGE